jgi:hypothetical protein
VHILDSDPNTNSSMLGFGRTVSHSRKGREDQGQGVPTDCGKVWAHGFAQQEGKGKGKGIPGAARRRRRWQSRAAAMAGPVVGGWGLRTRLRSWVGGPRPVLWA